MRSLQHISEESLSALDLANLINDTFLSPMQDFTPLSAESFQLLQDHSTEQPFVISTHAVYLQLLSINLRKAFGPNGVPAWLLKENADLLFDTISDIINSSFAERHGTRSTVRVILFDYRKAFDLIDHVLLAGKLPALDIPVGVLFWIIDLLTDRTQRVKLGEDCLSKWRNVPAEVPEGTKLRPWLFILMITNINTSNTNLWR
ncbi:hypothetical protein pdam_00023566 [Pocillopora damicornis]|uniref:Uncharacterized protein n=1 Tax=Pocillopora damicornis TaxID=46731 RepID=A0A3M6V604_POCDA|nr:hypothetical protein pdam_00023566 [Pocillopora damicornis]